VESTRIAEGVDPEDLHELYLLYRSACDACICEFEGCVLEYQGDGILACFGYPVAVENSSQRAINAALRLIRAVQNIKWSSEASISARAGIHTGIVVAGDLAGPPSRRTFTGLVGAALNVASRLQGMAKPNSVVISEEVRLLVGNQFETACIGEHHLKGLSRPIRAHEVLRAAPSTIQAERIDRASLPPMVGRKGELSQLEQCWALAQAGQGTVACVTGDPGIGKSRLISELCIRLQADPRVKVFELQCSPYYRNSPLFPVVETLRRIFAVQDGTAADSMRALEQSLEGMPNPEEAAGLLAALLSLPGHQSPSLPKLSPEAARKRTIECVAEWLLLHAVDESVLVVINDIHWIDASTLSLVQELAGRVPQRRAMIVLSSREQDAATSLSFAGAQRIHLGPLAAREMEQLVRQIAGGKDLPRKIVTQILDGTGGIPLFGEELTKAVVQSDALAEGGNRIQLAQLRQDLAVPATLQDLLAVRLERTGPGRRVAQLASILGRKFARALLAHIAEDETQLSEHLDLLVREGLLERVVDERDSFVFRHALIQKAAYESLLRSTRTAYHQRVAEVLASRGDSSHAYPPELVAQHFTLGGLHNAAVPLWLEAAGRSLKRSANVEAYAQAEEGLGCIHLLAAPESLKEAELLLHTIKGTALIAMRGWSVSEVGETFTRAEAISAALHGTQHTAALWGLWVYRFMRGELGVARQYAERILRIGEQVGDSAITIEGHWTLGATLYWQPELAASREHLEEAVRMYDPALHRQNAFVYGQDPGVSARAWLTFVLTLSGRTSDAIRCGQEALELAREVDHPFSTAWALAANTLLRVELNDAEGALELGDQALRYCTEQEQAFWVAALLMAVGWAKTRSGNAVEGIAMAEQGFAAYEATGARLILSFFAAILADCHMAAGNLGGAENWLQKGFAIAEAQNEAPIVPALLLIKGTLLLRKAPEHAIEAQAAFREALARAVEQGARMRQLQAATALAHLYCMGGLRDRAREVLEPVVTWFREFGDPSAAGMAIPLLEACSQG
jgi:class 3 adenylate cyclase/tetratricopeptide (TPR) repeat protein